MQQTTGHVVLAQQTWNDKNIPLHRIIHTLAFRSPLSLLFPALLDFSALDNDIRLHFIGLLSQRGICIGQFSLQLVPGNWRWGMHESRDKPSGSKMTKAGFAVMTMSPFRTAPPAGIMTLGAGGWHFASLCAHISVFELEGGDSSEEFHFGGGGGQHRYKLVPHVPSSKCTTGLGVHTICVGLNVRRRTDSDSRSRPQNLFTAISHDSSAETQ